MDEALTLLAEHDGDAKLLAGGHSLLPLMKLRARDADPPHRYARLKELSYVKKRTGTWPSVPSPGTTTSPRAPSPTPARSLLAHVAGQIGDPQVRHRGTIGGSIAHGDPA